MLLATAGVSSCCLDKFLKTSLFPDLQAAIFIVHQQGMVAVVPLLAPCAFKAFVVTSTLRPYNIIAASGTITLFAEQVLIIG